MIVEERASRDPRPMCNRIKRAVGRLKNARRVATR